MAIKISKQGFHLLIDFDEMKYISHGWNNTPLSLRELRSDLVKVIGKVDKEIKNEKGY